MLRRTALQCALSLRKTLPSFITNKTLRITEMSCSGSPGKATRSASLPYSMEPTRSAIPNNLASAVVVARRSGDLPHEKRRSTLALKLV